MTLMLERWECEEGYEIQIMLAHFEWIGDNGAGKIEGNSKESYSTRTNERSGNSGGSVEVKSVPDTVKVMDMVMTGA